MGHMKLWGAASLHPLHPLHPCHRVHPLHLVHPHRWDAASDTLLGVARAALSALSSADKTVALVPPDLEEQTDWQGAVSLAPSLAGDGEYTPEGRPAPGGEEGGPVAAAAAAAAAAVAAVAVAAAAKAATEVGAAAAAAVPEAAVA